MYEIHDNDGLESGDLDPKEMKKSYLNLDENSHFKKRGSLIGLGDEFKRDTFPLYFHTEIEGFSGELEPDFGG